MSVLGFQLPGSLAPGASKIASGFGASKAASAGLFANPVGLALAGGQLAFGIANMVQQGKAREQQIYNDTYKTAFQSSMARFRAEQQNQQIATAFNAKLDFVKNQIENNFLGAQASWTAEQMRLNEIYDKAAYQSQSMQKMLVEAMGSSAASEVYGKSARRGALVSTLGAYGRTRAQQADQLMSENVATAMRMRRTQQQFQAANKQALAQVSVLPVGVFMPASPSFTGGGASGLNTALQIAGIGMSAFQTGLQNTPKEMRFLGIQGQMG
jgi:hypothetical protein